MKTLLILLLIHCATSFAFADSWAPATLQTVSSPRGDFLLRSIPPKRQSEDGKTWSKMIFIVYRLDPDSQDYRETNRFEVEGHPLELFINDAGDRIVTMDQYFGIGQGDRVVVVYNASGRELKHWALKEFYDKKTIGDLTESTASVYWRGEAGWMSDQKSIWIEKPTLLDKMNTELEDYILDLNRLKITKRIPTKLKLDHPSK